MYTYIAARKDKHSSSVVLSTSSPPPSSLLLPHSSHQNCRRPAVFFANFQISAAFHEFPILKSVYLEGVHRRSSVSFSINPPDRPSRCSISAMTEIEQIPRSIAENGNALFGKYELGRLLGCGAFAKVYYARNVVSGQSVAVKVINKKKLASSSSGGGLAANIKREISIMRRLHHPNIVQLHEVLATRTKIYFVMEFVKGGELFAKVAKGRFTEDLSRKYFQQLISAVGHCHVRGVFHRDLKPENLLVDEGGNLKVSDFGLSAVHNQIRSDGLLHTLCGTPAYVAPEILSKRGYDGAKVDVWSCGVVLFVLNAGYLPFNDPNLMSMYKKIYKGEFRCPKWMSADLKRFINRVLDTNPVTRITIDEIVRDPWFKKGLKSAINFYGDDLSAKKNEAGLITKPTSLNAFDLISFSSGLDLSGLFDDSFNLPEDGERFLSTEAPDKVIANVEAFAKDEELRFKKNNKDWDVEIEGRNGNLAMGVGVYLLTDGLVVVEVKRIGGEAAEFRAVWKNHLKPRLVQQTGL